MTVIGYGVLLEGNEFQPVRLMSDGFGRILTVPIGNTFQSPALAADCIAEEMATYV